MMREMLLKNDVMKLFKLLEGKSMIVVKDEIMLGVWVFFFDELGYF